MRKCSRVAALALATTLLAAAPAGAQLPVPLPGGGGPAPQPYGAGGSPGFMNVLPPGTNGFDNSAQLAQFEATGARPAHNDDQRAMYANLVRAAPRIGAGALGRYFKDATFGTRPGGAERRYSPRADVTIV